MFFLLSLGDVVDTSELPQDTTEDGAEEDAGSEVCLDPVESSLMAEMDLRAAAEVLEVVVVVVVVVVVFPAWGALGVAIVLFAVIKGKRKRGVWKKGKRGSL